MLPSLDQLRDALARAIPGSAATVDGASLRIAPQSLREVSRWLAASPECGVDYVANLTAVDYPPDPAAGGAGKIDMVYHFGSMANKQSPVTVKAAVPRGNPVIESLVPLFRGAEYQEREVYDLYGVRFEGHPDLRRILLWEGFQGHPMRKDYVPEDQDA